MKTFKINKNTNKVTTTAPIDYDLIYTSGGNLCMLVDKDKTLEVTEAGKLHFEKYASGSGGELVKVCERDAKVVDIVDNENGERLIFFEYPYIEPLTVASFLKIDDNGEKKFKFYFTKEHNMVPLSGESAYVKTDFETYGSEYKVYVTRGKNIIYFTNLVLCYPGQFKRGENIFMGDGNCCPENPTLFNYDTMEKNSIIATVSGKTNGIEFTPEMGDQVLFCTNPYFWTDSEGFVHTFENVVVAKYTDFMGLGVVLEDDYDAKRMFQEYQVNEQFVNKVKSSIIPDFIDLEKVKYVPAYSGNSIDLATGLTFNLHFRSRVMDKTDTYKFEDTWHLDDTLNTWNGNSLSKPVKFDDMYNDSYFVNSSNLMGFLGFTDDDIYNQKNRVKQSFLRLSFYDSPNPLEQSLLYYSTIFLDSGDLFGKFVRRKAWLQEKIDGYDESAYPVVWSSASTNDPVPAVTSQIIVNDEYDTTRSGEGFNLYLFKQDAPIENELQDIYMKVEFNHAGYGRTIPLIFWRKLPGTDKPIKMSAGNYFDYLYIPIRITLSDKGYVYMFREADNDGYGIVWKDDRLIFNLFEPKIEAEGDIIPESDTVDVTVTGWFDQERNN